MPKNAANIAMALAKIRGIDMSDMKAMAPLLDEAEVLIDLVQTNSRPSRLPIIIGALLVGTLGLVVGAGGLRLAYTTTRELHQLEYTVRHDLGDPDKTNLGIRQKVADIDAKGSYIQVPCPTKPDPNISLPNHGICYKMHWVRRNAWEEMQTLSDEIDDLNQTTATLTPFDSDFLDRYVDKDVLMAMQADWESKHDPDHDGYWDYGAIPDDCPNEAAPYMVTMSANGKTLHGCPDRQQAAPPIVDTLANACKSWAPDDASLVDPTAFAAAAAKGPVAVHTFDCADGKQFDCTDGTKVPTGGVATDCHEVNQHN